MSFVVYFALAVTLCIGSSYAFLFNDNFNDGGMFSGEHGFIERHFHRHNSNDKNKQLCAVRVNATDKFDASAFDGSKNWYTIAYQLMTRKHHHNEDNEAPPTIGEEMKPENEEFSKKPKFCKFMLLKAENVDEISAEEAEEDEMAKDVNNTLTVVRAFRSSRFNVTSRTRLGQHANSSGVYDFHTPRRHHSDSGGSFGGHHHQRPRIYARVTIVDTDNDNFIILNVCGFVARGGRHHRRPHGDEDANCTESNYEPKRNDSENEISVANVPKEEDATNLDSNNVPATNKLEPERPRCHPHHHHHHRHHHHKRGHFRRFQSISILSTSKSLPDATVKQYEQSIVALGFSAKGFRRVNNSFC